jgi:CubicO group peptidase (beta-lactamase class C family)
MKNIRHYFLSIFIAFLWLTQVSWGQGLPTASPESVGLSAKRLNLITNLIQQHVDENLLAGAVALVARQGKTVYLKSVGLQDIEEGIEMNTNTIFRIASMTKPITSVAVMMLYEQGHFLLSDPISKYLPEFKEPKVLVIRSSENNNSSMDTVVTANREITIRNLLSHTSGLTYQWDEHLGEAYKNADITHGLLPDESTLAVKMKKLAEIPLLHHPGEKFTYSLSVDVLGYLVEVVSGMSLDEFFHQRIFEPLGMNDTYFYVPDEKLSRLAAVYAPNPEGSIKRLGDEPVVDGSFMYNTTYPFEGPKKYFSGGGGVRLLSRKSIELMTTDHVGDLNDDGFGLGFSVTRNLKESGELGSVGSYGWGGFWYTKFFIDPVEQLIGIYMTQLYPWGDATLWDKFSILVYQSIID